jgi:hypothetical protein
MVVYVRLGCPVVVRRRALASPELDSHPWCQAPDFLREEDALVIMKGDVSYKEFWVVNLKTGQERQLTSLLRESTIGDFDVSADGREIIFDRAREESDIVLFELPDR